MNEIANFRRWNYIEIFSVGTISKDNKNGIIKTIIFPRCYLVEWEDGQENHAYHHEIRKI